MKLIRNLSTLFVIAFVCLPGFAQESVASSSVTSAVCSYKLDVTDQTYYITRQKQSHALAVFFDYMRAKNYLKFLCSGTLPGLDPACPYYHLVVAPVDSSVSVVQDGMLEATAKFDTMQGAKNYLSFLCNKTGGD